MPTYYTNYSVSPIIYNDINGDLDIHEDVHLETIEGTNYNSISFKGYETGDIINLRSRNISSKLSLLPTSISIPINADEITSLIDEIPYVEHSILLNYKDELILIIYPNKEHYLFKSGIESFKHVATGLKESLNKNLLSNSDINTDIISRVIITPVKLDVKNNEIYHSLNFK